MLVLRRAAAERGLGLSWVLDFSRNSLAPVIASGRGILAPDSTAV